LAITGVSGSGKTYTSLMLATIMGKTAFIDTEKGSASKYAHKFDFDVLELNDHHPDKFVEAIKEAEKDYDLIVIDSLSHAWTGTNGCLELADRETAKSKSNNSYIAWGKVTPIHDRMIRTILGADAHIIATMRQKQKYEAGKNDAGKFSVTRLGLAPVQRDQVDYEFDIMGEMNIDNQLIITKSRMEDISGKVYDKPGKEFAEMLMAWCGSGSAPKEHVLDDGIQTRLEPIVNGHEVEIDNWLKKENRIKPNQTWRNMDPKIANRALQAPDKFLETVKPQQEK